MKKYLLTALLGVFGLCTAFASADDLIGTYFFTDSAGLNTSISIPSSVSQVYAILDIESGDGYYCSLSIHDSDYSNYKYFTSSYSNGGDNILDGTITSDCSDISDCVEIPLTVNSNLVDISDSTYTNFGFGCDHGGLAGTVSLYSVSSSSSDSDSSGTILPNGTDDLKGIVNGLESTMAEFVPYIVYIGLGIIVACLGFVAIRRLVNWVRSKIFDNF